MFDFDVVTDSPETIRLRKPAEAPHRGAAASQAAPPPAAPSGAEPDTVAAAE
jgi:hypothetical protein